MTALDNFIQELESNELIHNVFIEKNAPISEMAIEIISEDISYVSLKNDFEFFKNTNGLIVNWYKKDTDVLFQSGECNISGGMDAFFSTGKYIYWDEEGFDDKEYEKFCHRLIRFDKYEKAYDSIRNIAIEINYKKNKIEKLWYWNDEGDKYPLSLDLSNYYQNMIKTKSIVNWQLFFIDFKSIEFNNKYYREWFYGLNPEDTLEEMRTVLEVSKLFEKGLYNFLNNRYDRAKKEFKNF